MATATHYVYNPTGSAITVNANTVNSHATSKLALSDADQLAFVAAGARLSFLMPGTADAAHLVGYRHE